MNLPGGISGRLLSEFAAVDLLLSRPVTDRVELTTLLLLGRSLPVEELISPACWERAIYVRARREALLTALRHLSAHLRRPLKPWQQGLSTLVGMTVDYCRYCRQEGVVGHEGGITGLVDKAIAWHRQVREETVKRALAAFDDTTATALPPVPLPDDPALRFLDSVSDLYHEGVAMSHCIATYAPLAITGQCYLFHVEYGGQSASVQVDPAGRVVQSYGQHNSRNSASEYGTRALGRWGKALAALRPAHPPQPCDDDAVLLGDPFPF